MQPQLKKLPYENLRQVAYGDADPHSNQPYQASLKDTREP
jgi:hypothetical protein